MDKRKLKEEWLNVVDSEYSSNATADLAFDELCFKYEDSSRHYHNLHHIDFMLKLAREYRASIKSYKSLFFAIWFHDAIQNKGQNNEYKSAKYARKSLNAMSVPSIIAEKTYDLIISTKTHQPNDVEDCNLFLDFDLAILATEPRIYELYANNCRKEYSVPRFLYNRGRANFLLNMLKRDNIFCSDLIRNNYEQKARNNIKRELANLGVRT